MPDSPRSARQQSQGRIVADILLDIKAVNFRPEQPYTLTAGWASPVYIDCRKLISYPRARRKVIELARIEIEESIGHECLDAVAGGETAGIPFAAWMADKLALPMLYVRKKAKGFGRNAQIEGYFTEGDRILLVEDLTTDGRSKVNFCKALRGAGAKVDHIFVFFFYDIYPEGRKILADLGITMHTLATWWDVLRVAKASNKFEPKMLAEVEKFMHDPAGWSQAHGGVASAAAE